MKRFRRWLLEWVYRDGQVGQCEGIPLAEVYHDAQFVSTIAEALKLVESVDPRRFARITARIKWIVNVHLCRSGGQYDPCSHACCVDFRVVSGLDRPWAVGWCAMLLVHEATNSVIGDYGVAFTRKNRTRTKRLCVKEAQRFVARLALLQPEVANWLSRDLADEDWAPNATWTDRLSFLWSQVVETARRAWAELAEPAVGKYLRSS